MEELGEISLFRSYSLDVENKDCEGGLELPESQNEQVEVFLLTYSYAVYLYDI